LFKLEDRKRRGTGSFVALFDLKKAFDSVSHSILLNKISEIISKDSIEYILMAHILSSVTLKVRELSRVIYVNAAVP